MIVIWLCEWYNGYNSFLFIGRTILKRELPIDIRECKDLIVLFVNLFEDQDLVISSEDLGYKFKKITKLNSKKLLEDAFNKVIDNNNLQKMYNSFDSEKLNNDFNKFTEVVKQQISSNIFKNYICSLDIPSSITKIVTNKDTIDYFKTKKISIDEDYSPPIVKKKKEKNSCSKKTIQKIKETFNNLRFNNFVGLLEIQSRNLSPLLQIEFLNEKNEIVVKKMTLNKCLSIRKIPKGKLLKYLSEALYQYDEGEEVKVEILH